MENQNRCYDIMSIMRSDSESIAYAVPMTDKKERVEMFNAFSNPEKKMSDNVGDSFTIKNVAVTPVTTVSDTGELLTLPRVVVITADGHSYTATSVGVYNSIKSLYSMFEDDFLNGTMKVKIKQKTTRNGFKTLILEIV